MFDVFREELITGGSGLLNSATKDSCILNIIVEDNPTFTDLVASSLDEYNCSWVDAGLLYNRDDVSEGCLYPVERGSVLDNTLYNTLDSNEVASILMEAEDYRIDKCGYIDIAI